MIRFVVRWLFRFLILAIVFIVALVLLKDTIAKAVVDRQVRKMTGLEIRTSKVEIGLGAPTLTVEGLRIFNTPEFGGGVLLDAPELHLDYDREAILAGRLRFRLIRLNLKELQIVRSTTGFTNLTSILEEARGAAPWKANPAGRELVFDGIDTLNLSVGTVRYTDLLQPGRSRSLSLNVENELFDNLKTEADALLVLFKLAVRRGFQAWVPAPAISTNQPPLLTAPKPER